MRSRQGRGLYSRGAWPTAREDSGGEGITQLWSSGGPALSFPHNPLVHPLSEELGVRDALATSETLQQEDVLRVKPDGYRLPRGSAEFEELCFLELSGHVSLRIPRRFPIPRGRFPAESLDDLFW